jgi:hypothetical protein
MKRFVLFTWSDHEAAGGWNDFSNSFELAEDAIAAGKAYAKDDHLPPIERGWACWQVIDITTGQELGCSD